MSFGPIGSFDIIGSLKQVKAKLDEEYLVGLTEKQRCTSALLVVWSDYTDRKESSSVRQTVPIEKLFIGPFEIVCIGQPSEKSLFPGRSLVFLSTFGLITSMAIRNNVFP